MEWSNNGNELKQLILFVLKHSGDQQYEYIFLLNIKRKMIFLSNDDIQHVVYT